MITRSWYQTSLAIFGPPGIGKTTLLKSLPEEETVCLDLEAGMKSVQDWKGASIPVRSFGDFRDLAVLIGGADPAQDNAAFYSTAHFEHVRATTRDSGLEAFLATKSIVFVDSITDLSRQAMVYAKQQPEAISERSGKPDVRGAYGLLGREVIQALKHLQRKPLPKTAAQDFPVFASRALAALRRAAILSSAYLMGSSSMVSGS